MTTKRGCIRFAEFMASVAELDVANDHEARAVLQDIRHTAAASIQRLGYYPVAHDGAVQVLDQFLMSLGEFLFLASARFRPK